MATPDGEQPPICLHPEAKVVRRMTSFVCDNCGEMWAKKDDLGNYKEQYDGEHQKLLKLEEDRRVERNSYTENVRRLGAEIGDLKLRLERIAVTADANRRLS